MRVLMAGYRSRSAWAGHKMMLMNTEELASIWHFPNETVKAQLVQRTESKKGAAPTALPLERPIESSDVREAVVAEKLKEEHSLLGFYINEHPLDTFDLRGQISIDRIKQLRDGGEITLACVVATKQEITTKTKKQKMAFLTLEDATGQIEAVAFSKQYAQFQKLIDSGYPLFIYGHLEITEGEIDNLYKIRVGKINRLDRVVRRVSKQKSEPPFMVMKSDKLFDTIRLLKSSEDGSIEVRPVIELTSGNRVYLSKVIKVDKNISGVEITNGEMGRVRRKIS